MTTQFINADRLCQTPDGTKIYLQPHMPDVVPEENLARIMTPRGIAYIPSNVSTVQSPRAQLSNPVAAAGVRHFMPRVPTAGPNLRAPFHPGQAAGFNLRARMPPPVVNANVRPMVRNVNSTHETTTGSGIDDSLYSFAGANNIRSTMDNASTADGSIRAPMPPVAAADVTNGRNDSAVPSMARGGPNMDSTFDATATRAPGLAHASMARGGPNMDSTFDATATRAPGLDATHASMARGGPNMDSTFDATSRAPVLDATRASIVLGQNLNAAAELPAMAGGGPNMDSTFDATAPVRALDATRTSMVLGQNLNAAAAPPAMAHTGPNMDSTFNTTAASSIGATDDEGERTIFGVRRRFTGAAAVNRLRAQQQSQRPEDDLNDSYFIN